MKKRLSILIVSAVIAGMILSLVGTVLVSQAASAEKDQNSYRQAPKPIPATDVHLIKKAPLPPVIGETKSKPDVPPGQQDKEKKKRSEEQVATGVLGEPFPAGASKYAIIIGICDYPDGSRDYDLCTSDGDSLRMYKALTTLYGYESNNIHLLKDMGGTTGLFYGEASLTTYIAPTRDAIYDAIIDIKNKVATDSAEGLKDEVTFFFSGHGADGIAGDKDSEKRDEGIVVHDSDNGEFDGNPQVDIIWDGELRTAFADFATNRIAFVFDTCLAGGMDDLKATGRVVSMGTSETSVSYVYSSDLFNLRIKEMKDVDDDGQKDGEGVFTRYFVNKGMLLEEADEIYEEGDHNGQVVIEEAFDYAKEIIPSIWKRQKPTISDNFDDDLLL